MAVTFLSEDWASAVSDAINSHEGFKGAIGSNDLSLQFNVSDAPDGDVSYYLKAEGGDATFALGTAESPDVTVNWTYDTASSIHKGDMNVQTAFMTGKLKVSGNLAKLMMHQSAIQQWQAATSELDVDY